jgi:hypothetical protein
MSNNGYRGRSKATLELLEACKKIIEETQPITVRGVCYRLFVAGLIDSMAVKNTQKISRLLTWAREEGEIEWDWIVDDSRRMERQPHWRDLEGYAEAIEESYRRDFWAHQLCRVIVISEKATVSGILRPVLEEYGVPFFAAHGFNSATKVHELAEQIQSDGRIYHFLYVGDYDCSGMHMSEEDLPERLRRYGAKKITNESIQDWLDKIASGKTAGYFSLERIALTDRDVESLPSFPAKKTDPRYDWYVDEYGEEAWELDAMDPNTLRERVLENIKQYVRADDWEQHKKIEAVQRETTKRIAQAMAGAK